MDFDVGDLVTRKSHNNDTVFSITDIIDGIYYLSGLNVRLIADAFLEDLVKYEDQDVDDESSFLERIKVHEDLDRTDYFYLPGKILHIDGDSDYLKRCSKFYEESNIWAMCINETEDVIPLKIHDLLNEYKPNIVVITGHDAYYKKKGNINDLNSYKNSSNFIEAVKEARLYEKEHDKLIIIAGKGKSGAWHISAVRTCFRKHWKPAEISAISCPCISVKDASAIT